MRKKYTYYFQGVMFYAYFTQANFLERRRKLFETDLKFSIFLNFLGRRDYVPSPELRFF
jgi:hypothetical protein